MKKGGQFNYVQINAFPIHFLFFAYIKTFVNLNFSDINIHICSILKAKFLLF